MRAPGRISRYPITSAGRQLALPGLLVLLACLSVVAGQNPGPAEPAAQETQPTFKLQVERNLVLVRVVVRDSKGKLVGNLGKDDFRLLDEGKPQAISQFAVEGGSSQPGNGGKAAPRDISSQAPPEAVPLPSPPQRYLALYFDDIHAKFEDLSQARAAADRFLATTMQPGDRVGIFTSSGIGTADFTDARSKLHEALLKLHPRPRGGSPQNDCPQISDYQADRIVNYEDPDAISLAVDEAVRVCHLDPRVASEMYVKALARQALGIYEMQARYSLQALANLVRQIAARPGQRNIVWVSPGFLPLSIQFFVGEIADRALRSNVIISSLDPKGLAVLLPIADAASQRGAVGNPRLMVGFALDSDVAASAVLSELAEDTGGEFFHNNNDLELGFRKLAAPPEVYYVLAFSPQNLKLDGRFHKLKAKLVGAHGFSVQARRGYFAPKKLVDAKAQAQEEIEQAAFSREESKELSVQVNTQFFKINDLDAELSVLTHLDVQSLQFRKEQQKSLNKLKFVTVLFDGDGKYVDGREKAVELQLSDASLQRLLKSGITIKTSFKVKLGTYLVREVVREEVGGQISGVNRSVEISF